MKILLTSILISLSFFASNAVADGCAPGEPCWKQYKPKPKPVPRVVTPPSQRVQPPVVTEPAVEPVMMMEEEDSGFLFAISPGVNVLYFACSEPAAFGALYADARKEGVPINLRLGIEMGNFNVDQFVHTPSSSWFGEEPDMNLYRIPLSVEYVMPVADGTEVLVGGGPDLLRTTGAGSDTSVGFHLGARLRQAITENVNVSVDAGYLWGETTHRNEDLDLDSAYTGASVGYQF